MSAFRVGTSGWHYRHWRGDFYPRDLDSRDWLRFYAQHFDTVELNSSFYRLPTEQALTVWRETAPPGFIFAVKASRYLTHLKGLAVEPESIERFFARARLLGAHLGPVLYQLPPTFARTNEHRGRFERFLGRLPEGFTHVFEFRDPSWFAEETMSALDANGAAFCAFDLPGLACPLRVTGGVFYMRFHGTGARYGGDYPEPELRNWAERLRTAASGTREAYVYFNNDVGGFAPRNAATLRDMLDAS